MILWIYLLLAYGYSSIMAAEPAGIQTTPYLCQFVFTAFDEDGKPLDVQFSRAALKTARLIETESLMHAKIHARAFETHKGLRVLIEDFILCKTNLERVT